MLIGDRLVTAPSGQVVSTEDAKVHLNVLHDEDDVQIAAYLADAVATIEAQGGLFLRSQTREASFDRFPYSTDWLDVPNRPVTAVNSVRYYATDGTLTTLANCQAAIYGFQARVKPPIDQSWPPVQCTRMAPVLVEYVVGFAIGTLPRDIVGAIKLIVADRYENKGDDTRLKIGISPAVERVIGLHGFGTAA